MKRRMRCIVHCAKDGERLGCVLSSRVPGRRDALHEHVLTSCAANNGFSAKLEFEIFWLLKPSQSIFLSLYVACIVCKCCGLSVAMPIANNPTPSLQRNYLNHYTNTQYQPKIIYISGIYLIENYFLHTAPLSSFSNCRSAKSKT